MALSFGTKTFLNPLCYFTCCVSVQSFYICLQSTDENWKPSIVGKSVQIVHKVIVGGNYIL